MLLNLSHKADLLDLLTEMFAGKEVVLARATLLHCNDSSSVDGRMILSQGYRYREGFCEVPNQFIRYDDLYVSLVHLRRQNFLEHL